MISRLVGTIQPYAWGSTTFIPRLLGTRPTGEPQAELWLGAHPSAPSLVSDRPLDELVREDPIGTVGAPSEGEFGPRLPYLLKVLSASKPLSLQAHPSRTQAEEGFAREEEAGIASDSLNRTYRDDWPKPEALCVLDEAEVLCGFREPYETYELFRQLGVAPALDLVSPLQGGSAERLEEVFGRILRLTESERHVVGAVAAAAAQVTSDGELGIFAQTARELGEPYPDDPGVLAALLMNRVTLQQNEAIFLPAGNLHAYLRGNGMEIMANSDNVLRGGLTSKHIDVEELLTVLDFTPGFPGLVPCVEGPAGVWAYQTPAPEFALWRLEVAREVIKVPRVDGGRVLLVTAGTVTVTAEADQLVLSRGQSAFVTAGEDARIDGAGIVFVAGPGIG